MRGVSEAKASEELSSLKGAGTIMGASSAAGAAPESTRDQIGSSPAGGAPEEPACDHSGVVTSTRIVAKYGWRGICSRDNNSVVRLEFYVLFGFLPFDNVDIVECQARLPAIGG